MLDRKAEMGRRRADCTGARWTSAVSADEKKGRGDDEAEGLTGVCRGTWASRLGGDPWGGGRGRSMETGGEVVEAERIREGGSGDWTSRWRRLVSKGTRECSLDPDRIERGESGVGSGGWVQSGVRVSGMGG